MLQSKLDKLLTVLDKISQNNFKITDAMQHIGILNKTALIRRLFVDITSREVIWDHLGKVNGIHVFHEKLYPADYIRRVIKLYPIGGEHIANMFILRVEFAQDGGYSAVARLDLSPAMIYMGELVRLGLIDLVKTDWDGILLPNDCIQVDSRYDLDVFFCSQFNTLPWEELIVEYDQKESKTTSQYPMQPIHLDRGVIRFEKNPIIDWMADRIGLNEIIAWVQNSKIDEKYVEQFHQLLGYSISLYNNLPGVSDESCAKANAIMESLLAQRVIHFTSRGAMDVKGLGETIITQLVEKDLMCDDIYTIYRDDFSDRLKMLGISDKIISISR